MHLVSLRFISEVWAVSLFIIILTASWLTSPAQAHCAGNHTGNHPHCSGGGEPPPPTAIKQEIVTVQDSGKQRQKIVVMNADGTDVKVVFEGDRHVAFTDVSWSGNGSKILFSGTVNGQTGIHWVKVFDLDGSGNHQSFAPGVPVFVATASSTPRARWSPREAPDGKEWIAYTDNWQIWLVHPDTREKLRLSSEDTTRLEYHPTWSPNADRIAFLSAPAEVSCSCPGDVGIMHLTSIGGSLVAPVPDADRESLIVNNSDAGGLQDQLANDHFFEAEWANNADWIVTRRSVNDAQFYIELWIFPTNPSDVESKAKAITSDLPELSYHSAVWSPRDDKLLFKRDGYGGVCDIPDNNDQPQLQGGPSSRVIAPLLLNASLEIEELDICKATLPLDWLGQWYGWWRGGDGLPPPPAP